MAVSDATTAGAAGTYPKWVSGRTYAADYICWSPISRLNYIRLITGGGTTDPSADGTNWGVFGPSRIKSVQRGVITITGAATLVTATITAVDTSKSVCRFMGAEVSAGTTWGASTGARVTLTNSTTVTASRQDASGNNTLVGYEVEEWW